MFPFFTSLADMYSKVLMPPKSLGERLRLDATDKPRVLDRCLKRLEWERSQARCVRVFWCGHNFLRDATNDDIRFNGGRTGLGKRQKIEKKQSERPWCA